MIKSRRIEQSCVTNLVQKEGVSAGNEVAFLQLHKKKLYNLSFFVVQQDDVDVKS